LAFEDELMDITVRRDGELLWCLEVKERADQLERLLKGVAANGSHVELGAPDRGRDALRKAKYLVKNRPEYFTGIAIGLQRHFQMSYTRSVSFEMVEAAPPLRQVAHPPPV
jgi:hypothetical protein